MKRWFRARGDKMELTYFCEKIGLPEEAIRQILDFREGERVCREVSSLFRTDREGFFGRILHGEQTELCFLSVYCRMAAELFSEYQKRGIPERVFWDTFRDLAIWCRDCRKKTGIYGIREYEWFVRHLELTIFRLGRLEFERMPSQWDIPWEGMSVSVGEPLISIHIPEDGPLEENDCIQSVLQAFAFWGKDIPYVCHSWLLGPELAELLGESSRIRRFRAFFHLISADYQEREAEERIFSRLEPDPENYPGKTSLQRNARAHLIAGGRLGNGLGLLRTPFPQVLLS